MKPAHAVVALGLAAMVPGAVSLHAVAGGSSEGVEVVAATPTMTGVAGPGWEGVDRSIQRVLSEVGLAERYPEGRLEEIPDEVVRALSALGVPLVLSEGSGGWDEPVHPCPAHRHRGVDRCQRALGDHVDGTDHGANRRFVPGRRSAVDRDVCDIGCHAESPRFRTGRGAWPCSCFG